MAEHKRIPFETVKPLTKDKKTSDLSPTFRFNLPLQESNEKTCPEFSYGELVKSKRPDEKKCESEELFGDDDDDQKLREIAKKFEEKYGPKTGNKKRKKMGRWEDYIDRGMGYDETDPFIDNDEAYDELVPSTLTTQFGGFYINSGELEFKTISDTDSDGPQDGIKRKRRRRRRDADEKDLKKKRFRDGFSGSRGRGRKSGLDKLTGGLIKTKSKSQPTVASLLQERKAQLLQQNQELEKLEPKIIEIQEQQHPPPKETKKEIVEEPLLMAESPLPAPVIESSEDEDAFVDFDQLACSNDKSENNINDIIESVIRNSEDVLNNGNLLMYAGGGSSDGEEVGLTIADVEAPKLPENLSLELNEMVKKIKQAAISSEQGKCKFFNHDVNKLLLNIELKSRELSCTQRSMIYSHLASYLPCTKETLLKRAKKLHLDQEDGKLLEPMQRLKKGIDEVLPSMIEKFSAACLAAGDIKPDSEELVLAGSDGDDSQGKDEKKGSMLPKKKFEWNDHMRELLCEVIRIKLKCYEVSKMRAQSAEDYLYQFLDHDVNKLWPPGWVNTKILLKESRSAHAYVTSVKLLKKPITVVKKLNATAPSQSELIPQSTIVKYSNVPQISLVQETHQLLETLPQVALEEEPACLQNVQATSVLEDRTLVPNKMNPSASAYLDTTTMEQIQEQVQVSSPSKRIFTLMNTEEAAQVVEAQKTTNQTFFGATMLDRIICASLADFPNSGTSTQSVTIERTPRAAPKTEPLQKQLHVQQQPSEPVAKNENVLLKTPTHLLSESSKTSNTVYASTPTVSILKSNYQSSSQPQQTLQTLHQAQLKPNRVLEHITPMTVSSSHTAKQVSPNSMSSQHIRPSLGSSLPMQTYEFQEAFKRSLSNNTNASSSDLSAARNYPRKRQVSEESDEQPMNFSNSQSSAHYVASQELNRLASSAHPPSFQSQPANTSNPTRVPRSSPEYVSGFAEGMKGFPLPLKTVVNPPPAHSYQSNRRTSPNTDPGFTSPHRHNNSQSPHQLATSTHSPPQSVANHSPYQSTAPLTHFSSPDSTHSPRSIIQTAWRTSTTANSTTAASSNFSMPSQYSTASSSVNYNQNSSTPSMNHNLANLGPPPGHHFLPAAAPTSAQRSHNKPYATAQTQQAMQRGVYGQMFPTGSNFPNTGNHGAVGGVFSEPTYGQNTSHQLTDYYGISQSFLTGPGQQGSHTRIP